MLMKRQEIVGRKMVLIGTRDANKKIASFLIFFHILLQIKKALLFYEKQG
jgi:hypothetical protein